MLPGPPQAAHRCPTCRLVRTLCVCSFAPRLALATRVIMVIHAREWRRASNTGHFAQLAVEGAQVRLHGLAHEPLDTSGIDGASPTTLVLFPGFGARSLTPALVQSLPRPLTLLVPDGNWPQAKNMMRRVPLLRQATPVELPGPILALARPRRNVFAGRMATFEALALALGALEGAEVEAQLLDFFRRAVDRMMMLRGKLRADQVHGGVGPAAAAAPDPGAGSRSPARQDRS